MIALYTSCHYDSLGHCIKYASFKVAISYLYNSSNVMKSIEVGKGVKLVSLLETVLALDTHKQYESVIVLLGIQLAVLAIVVYMHFIPS